tara:strand:- start:260 stop:505 length:246 start_codon:yes stop_codon:yes gene_type:complete
MARTKVENGVEIPLTEAEETARDAEEQAWADGKATRNAMVEIEKLESFITPRRLRDALANDAAKSWVAAVEAKIATERGKL